VLSTGTLKTHIQRFHCVARRIFVTTIVGLAFLTIGGCSLVPDVRHKPQLINPFPQIQRVAVLPFINQSEEATLSGERVAMAYANEIQSIRGFEVLPLGAVKFKLAEFKQPLARGEDFQAFARFLGVDAVVLGSVTDFTAYYPPRMSMKVNWYAANPGFHPIQPGYGLPWGTSEEKKIPRWVHNEAQRALAAEQLKSQTPVMPEVVPIMPEDRVPTALPSTEQHASPEMVLAGQTSAEGSYLQSGLPTDWPDPRGFIPDGPQAQRPPLLAQHEPVISHMRSFNGHDEDLTEQLEDYFYFRDDARFGGWQAYLQRSEDFIRFCCYQHLSETLISRGGQDKSRLIFRWPIDRYQR
jgi:hypothetical protein